MDELTFKLLQYLYISIFLKISKKVNKNTRNGDLVLVYIKSLFFIIILLLLT